MVCLPSLINSSGWLWILQQQIQETVIYWSLLFPNKLLMFCIYPSLWFPLTQDLRLVNLLFVPFTRRHTEKKSPSQPQRKEFLLPFSQGLEMAVSKETPFNSASQMPIQTKCLLLSSQGLCWLPWLLHCCVSISHRRKQKYSENIRALLNFCSLCLSIINFQLNQSHLRNVVSKHSPFFHLKILH